MIAAEMLVACGDHTGEILLEPLGGIPCLHNHVRICLVQQTYQVMSMAHCWQHMLYAQLGLEVFEGTCPASISKSSRKDWKPFD